MAIRFKLVPQPHVMKILVSVIFWIWGVAGLAMGCFSVTFIFHEPAGVQILIPTFAFAALIWIGGIVLFGVGALICAQRYAMREP